MQSNKGITLVALVVTIVVLIILAGISISLLLGENGLITKAQQAKKEQKVAQIKEKIGIEILDAEAEAQIRNEELEKEKLNEILSKYGELQEDGDTIKLKEIDEVISLKDIYNGTTSDTGSYSDNKEKIELLERKIADLQKQLEDSKKNEENLKSDIEEGKKVIASAITSMGVDATSDSTFEDLSHNIKQISSTTIKGMEKNVTISTSGNWEVPHNGYYKLSIRGGYSGTGYAKGCSICTGRNDTLSAVIGEQANGYFYLTKGTVLSFNLGTQGASNVSGTSWHSHDDHGSNSLYVGDGGNQSSVTINDSTILSAKGGTSMGFSGNFCYRGNKQTNSISGISGKGTTAAYNINNVAILQQIETEYPTLNSVVAKISYFE